MLDDLRQDLRDGARRLRRAPGFTTVAVLTLALGIGANTAFFSVLNAVVLRPLPYPEPERLVQLLERNPTRAAELGRPSRGVPLSAHNYLDYREENTVFSEMGWAAPLFDRGTVNVVGAGRPLRVPGVMVSGSFFRVLGVEPLLGAVWPESADTFAFEGPRVVMLGHGFWQRRFAADPGVVGRSLTIDDWPHTIAGVLPPDFRMPPLLTQGELGTSQGLFDTGDLYVPLGYNAFGLSRRSRQFTAVARLREGVDLAEAQAEMSALAAGLADAYPQANEGWDVEVRSLAALAREQLGPRLGLLLAAVGMVLLIACANIAHLLLARATGRQTEMAVRAAIGGSRWRLGRQLVTESVLLAVVGGAAGLLLAWAGQRSLVAMIPAGVPRAEEASLDPTVLLFALGVTLATGLLFGLAPAWRGARVELASVLQGGGRVAGAGRRAGSPVLVAAQVGLALVLLVGAGLLTRSFLRLALAEPGYDPEGLLRVSLYVGRPSVYNETYWDCDLERPGPLLWGGRCRPDQDAMQRFYERVIERVEAVPGVRSVGLTNQAPLVDGPGFHPLRVEPPGGRLGSDDGRGVQVGSTAGRAVYPGYFDTMGIRVLRGRAFQPGDPRGWGGVAVVNERLASSLWPDDAPLGHRLSFYGQEWMTVIGVVENTADTTLRDRVTDDGTLESKVYHLGHDVFMDLMVRVDDDPLAMVSPIENAVLEVDAELPLGAVASLEELARVSNSLPRFYAVMVGLFAAFSLLLTAVGVYGVVATAAGRRTREIGVRMALGATAGQVRRLLLGQALGPVAAGLALGGLGVVALTRIIGALLYGMDPADPLTVVGIVILLGTVTLLATYLPARRASRMDPTSALRTE